ncbi:hypothetical protein ERO13_A11G316380v2 [Gossypium hirsutum]|uniref:Uncharacterized protein n=1 Tax=Gossypium darwinii TaxID=34276 RepID=A0A5D2EUU3_GOSDA|nr:hypothetical protein ERO13_A11G316380v2 [Gossypium hirsutum]TYG96759.1 hypothetical protein ES288_A11G378200v1 [Gossypium darwinii]
MEEPKNRTCILHQLICPWHCNLRSLWLGKIPQCRHLPEYRKSSSVGRKMSEGHWR